MKPVPLEEVADLIVSFLGEIGIRTTCVKIAATDMGTIDYRKIAVEYNLPDERDLVWLKFAENGAVGVVATSNDVNLEMPSSAADYDAKDAQGRWLHTSSGILLHKLGVQWAPFVLVFPLPAIPEGYNRHDIEQAVGNMLISENVPLLDYCSHIY